MAAAAGDARVAGRWRTAPPAAAGPGARDPSEGTAFVSRAVFDQLLAELREALPAGALEQLLAESASLGELIERRPG